MKKSVLVFALLSLSYLPRVSAAIEVLCNQREQSGDRILSVSIEKVPELYDHYRASIFESTDGKSFRKDLVLTKIVFESSKDSEPNTVMYSESALGASNFVLSINISVKNVFQVYSGKLTANIESLKTDEEVICQFYNPEPSAF